MLWEPLKSIICVFQEQCVTACAAHAPGGECLQTLQVRAYSPQPVPQQPHFTDAETEVWRVNDFPKISEPQFEPGQLI